MIYQDKNFSSGISWHVAAVFVCVCAYICLLDSNSHASALTDGSH